MKHELKFSLLIASSLIFSTFVWCLASTHGTPSQRPDSLSVDISLPNRVAGGETIVGKIRVSPRPTADLVFNLTSNKPNLLKMDPTVTIKAGEDGTFLSIGTVSTVIRTAATIQVSLQKDAQTQAQKDVELVPALIKSVSLNAKSMLGTNGSKLQCKIELRSPAPTGGIELYLSSLKFTPSLSTRLRWAISNPRVDAGSSFGSFEIRYEDLKEDQPAAIEDQSGRLDGRPRIVELLVGLDPTNTNQFVEIPGLSHKLGFEFVPLRVVSISVRPQTLSGGAEGTVTFALNGIPGPNEEAEYLPYHFSSFWLRPLGSSCQSYHTRHTIPLTGGPVFTLKACSAGPPSPPPKIVLKIHDQIFAFENFLQLPNLPTQLP